MPSPVTANAPAIAKQAMKSGAAKHAKKRGAAVSAPKPKTRSQTRTMTVSTFDPFKRKDEDDGMPTLSPGRRELDPFLYFSDDRKRLEHLLGRELPADVTPARDAPVERKTRLSFEVDPTWALVHSFPELLEGQDGDEPTDEEFLSFLEDAIDEL